MTSKVDQVVFVIDDDESMRSAVSRLLGAVGLEVRTFPSGQNFLASKLPEVPGCVVLDIRLPGLSGVRLMTRAREDARRRQAQNPEWGWRLIENEEWAKKSKRGASRPCKGQLVGAGGFAED